MAKQRLAGQLVHIYINMVGNAFFYLLKRFLLPVTYYGRKRFLLPVTYFSTNLVFPFTVRVTGIINKPRLFIPAVLIQDISSYQLLTDSSTSIPERKLDSTSFLKDPSLLHQHETQLDCKINGIKVPRRLLKRATRTNKVNETII